MPCDLLLMNGYLSPLSSLRLGESRYNGLNACIPGCTRDRLVLVGSDILKEYFLDDMSNLPTSHELTFEWIMLPFTM